MTNICLNGFSGRMGQTILKCSENFNDLKITIGIDSLIKKNNENLISLYNSFHSINDKNINVIIDVSSTNAIYDLYAFSLKNNTPVVLCTTGYNDEQKDLILKMSKIVPVFQSGNMSIGINIINHTLKYIIKFLYNDFDIEILEKHHNKKIDSPSGTALLLADTIAKSIPYKVNYSYNRNCKRMKTDIGIQSIRGGTIIGEHDIIFAGDDEIIKISHTALSRKIFANGALYAAKFLSTCNKAKIYNMDDLLKNK